MDNLLFSVSMCVYRKDNPEHFREAVESILNQTLPPNEVVLVVDGPVPDALERVIHTYASNPVFHVIRLPVNQGHGNARREGLANCKHELVALMDADDISVPDRFEKQIAFFQSNPQLAIVGGNISEFVDRVDHIVGKRVVPQEDTDIKRYMRKRCPMNQMTVMLKKSCVDEAGGYADWYCNEDYYLWIRMAQKGFLFANIHQDLVNVRVGQEMYQRRGGWKYFKSEAKLQKYMLQHKMISFFKFCLNVSIRLVVQVLLPNKLRGWFFQKIAREKA
ncbi:MAG: glycosyltransferase [Clostridia bacterium]|jgi:glycosyltransferase involved in cell wall biosynthesis